MALTPTKNRLEPEIMCTWLGLFTHLIYKSTMPSILCFKGQIIFFDSFWLKIFRLGIQQQRAKENQRDIGRESFMILRESMTVRDDSLGLLPRKDSLAVPNKWQLFRSRIWYCIIGYFKTEVLKKRIALNS